MHRSAGPVVPPAAESATRAASSSVAAGHDVSPLTASQTGAVVSGDVQVPMAGVPPAGTVGIANKLSRLSLSTPPTTTHDVLIPTTLHGTKPHGNHNHNDDNNNHYHENDDTRSSSSTSESSASMSSAVEDLVVHNTDSVSNNVLGAIDATDDASRVSLDNVSATIVNTDATSSLATEPTDNTTLNSVESSDDSSFTECTEDPAAARSNNQTASNGITNVTEANVVGNDSDSDDDYGNNNTNYQPHHHSDPLLLASSDNPITSISPTVISYAGSTRASGSQAPPPLDSKSAQRIGGGGANGSASSSNYNSTPPWATYPNSDAYNGRVLLPEIHPDDVGKACLVLDLDETLVHSSFKAVEQADFIIPVEIDGAIHNVFVVKRPGVDTFLQRLGSLFEIVVFTASLAKYADPVLDELDKHHVVRHRLFREACIQHKGNYVKDLSMLGRNLKNVIIIDNSPASYIFHPMHAVPVSSWFNDPDDGELIDLLPFLEDLATVDDVSLVLDNSNDPSIDMLLMLRSQHLNFRKQLMRNEAEMIAQEKSILGHPMNQQDNSNPITSVSQ